MSEGFRLAEDTTTWSSLAIARDNNVQQSGSQQLDVNVNNNLTETGLPRNNSVESLVDYEGEFESNFFVNGRSKRSITECSWLLRNSEHRHESCENNVFN